MQIPYVAGNVSGARQITISLIKSQGSRRGNEPSSHTEVNNSSTSLQVNIRALEEYIGGINLDEEN